MLPGKKYLPEDILRIIWKRIWLLVLPFAIVSAGVAVYARYLPDLYRSETLIRVVPQRVPESYVRSTVTARVEDRMRAITEGVLSRTRLERLILEENLYPAQRATGIMQDVVENMRGDIAVRSGAGDTFRISYAGENPVTVRKVAEALTSAFINESLQDRASLAENTNQFLEGQLENARIRLEEHEAKLEDFKRTYGAELPEHLESNIQAIQGAQLQIQALVQTINQGQNRRLLLEQQLGDLESQPASVPAAPVAVASSEAGEGGTAAQRLAAAQQLLTTLLGQYTAEHPDVVKVKARVAELQQEAEAEALRTPLSGPGAGLSPAEQARQRRIEAIRSDIAQLDQQIEAALAEERRLRSVAATYQQRADLAPTRESQMIGLTRDYGTLERLYTSLLTKREDAQMAANLERRASGEQFEILDPARLPARPSSPDRQFYNLAGMAIALALGLALIALREYLDASLKTDVDVKGVLGLPVLAVVPLMRSELERRRLKRRRIFAGFLYGSTALGCLAILTYTFVR